MKKAQLKMMESMMVIVIFMFLLGIGIIFYARVQSSLVKTQIVLKEETRAVMITQEIAFLPELSCTDTKVETSTCIDLYKALALGAVIADSADLGAKRYYGQKLQNANITFRRVYPVNTTWEVISEPDPADIDEARERLMQRYRGIIPAETAELPVSLKDATKPYYEYELWLIRVEVLKLD